jgi:Fe-S cluster biogenesis protein NfuA
MRQKVEDAISGSIRPYLQSLGYDISLVSVTGTTITVRITQGLKSIMSIALQLAVEMKIRELVPEVTWVNFS